TSQSNHGIRRLVLVNMMPYQPAVYPAARDGAHAWSDDRHPPPSVSRAEDVAAPSGRRREQPRTEVAGGVDRVSGIETERGADEHHQQSDDDGGEAGRSGRIP